MRSKDVLIDFIDFAAKALLVLYGATAIAVIGFVGGTWDTLTPGLLIESLRWLRWLIIGVVCGPIFYATTTVFQLSDLEKKLAYTALGRMTIVAAALYLYATSGGDLMRHLIEHQEERIEQGTRVTISPQHCLQ